MTTKPPKDAKNDKNNQAHPPKPSVREEKVDDQNEAADNTGLYDRDEDMYSQDARVPTDEVRDGSDKDDDEKKVQRNKKAGA